MKAAPYYPWIDVPDAVFDALARNAQARDDLHADHDKRVWKRSGNLAGLCAEWCYGVLTDQEPDYTLRRGGDFGTDFPSVDVKGITYLHDPHLRVDPSERKLRAPLYFAVTVNLDRRLCKPNGYATRPMVVAAPKRDYGYGARHSIPCRDLLSADVVLARLLAKGGTT